MQHDGQGAMLDAYYDEIASQDSLWPMWPKKGHNIKSPIKERTEMSEKITNVKLKVVGVTFANEDGSGTHRQEVIKQLDNNSTITLQREPTNRFDPNAIKVMTEHGQAGYIAKEYAAILSGMIDNEGKQFTAAVSETGFHKNNHYLHIIVNEV